MLTANEILKLKKAPNELLEIYLYQALEMIRWRYYNLQISKSQAIMLKDKLIKKYEGQVKEYEFMLSMFNEHIDNIKKTESLRIEFRKNPKLETAKKIIELYSGERF